jgi:hypothetical protein
MTRLHLRSARLLRALPLRERTTIVIYRHRYRHRASLTAAAKAAGTLTTICDPAASGWSSRLFVVNDGASALPLFLAPIRDNSAACGVSGIGGCIHPKRFNI